MSTLLPEIPPIESLERAYYPKSVPCFHCSKSLQQLLRNHPAHPGKYLGFLVEGPDKLMHPIHGSCVGPYFCDVPVVDEGEWTAVDEAAEQDIIDSFQVREDS